VVDGEFKGFAQQKVRSLLATRVTISFSRRTLFHVDSYFINNKQLAHIFRGNSVCLQLTTLKLVVCDGSSEVK